MNIIRKLIFVYLVLSSALLSCNSRNGNTVRCEAKQHAFVKILNSETFALAYKEFYKTDNKIYIIDTAKQHLRCNIVPNGDQRVAFLDSFNFDRDFLLQGNDQRFAMEMPVFLLKADTLKVDVSLPTSFSRLYYEFVKADGDWKLVNEGEVLY